MMSPRVQRVLVIQDASIELSAYAIRWAISGLSLKPGDKIKLLRVVQLFRTVSASSSMTCGLLGNRSRRLHSSATIKQREESINKEIGKKRDEDHNSDEITTIMMLTKLQQFDRMKEMRSVGWTDKFYSKTTIELEKDVEAGHSPKEAAVLAAKNWNATYLILDRKLKKDQKYFMDNLTCGILRMKHDRNIKHVRSPKTAETEEIQLGRGQSSSSNLMGEQQESQYQNSICSVCMNRRPKNELIREFSYADLQFATSGFSQQNLLSNNRKVFYGGMLSDGTEIVVRRRALEAISEMEFRSRIQMLGKARHENVVALIGSYSEGPERLLVYEYICNGSLNTHLSMRSRELTWERRMKIIMGCVTGLQYLHSKSFYGSMRPNNILLTHDYTPLLGNFGLTRNQYEDLDRFSDTRVLKTFEYLAPEYEETGIATSKTDVYSFGVVLLELITGRKTLEQTHGRSFLRWARPLLKEKSYDELIDPAVLEAHDLHQLFWLVRVAEQCLNREPSKRYSIDKVVNTLRYIILSCDNRAFSPTESETELLWRD